jgi:glycogen operon protein
MRTIGMFLTGTASEIRDKEGKPVEDHDFLLLLNAHHEAVAFRVPEDLDPSLWSVVFDTNQPDLESSRQNQLQMEQLT